MDENTPVIIVEDLVRISSDIAEDLKGILKSDVSTCSNYEDAEKRIKRLKQEGVQELLLVLDGSFPEREGGNEQPLANKVISCIAEQFGSHFLLYLIPFSANPEANDSMIENSKNLLPETEIIKLESKMKYDRIGHLILRKIQDA